MSEENVAGGRRYCGAMSQENVESIRALIPPPEVDMVPIFRDPGLFDEATAALERLVDAGGRVVVLVRDRARRDDTEAELELISASVWTFHDGLVVRVESFSNRGEAFEAAGLSQ